MARATSTLTRTGKPRLGTLSTAQLQTMRDEAKRGRDRQKYRKELERRGVTHGQA